MPTIRQPNTETIKDFNTVTIIMISKIKENKFKMNEKRKSQQRSREFGKVLKNSIPKV